MASEKKSLNPMDDLTSRQNLPSKEGAREVAAQRRAEEAAAAERRRKAAARGAASSDAKFKRAAEDEEQAMKDKQSKDAYERIKSNPFRKGGMTDLTGDGKVTRADVLKGRGVFKRGGKVKKMAEGGASTDKPERKSSGVKDLLGTLSPLYGMMSGKGLFGKNDIGLLPALARRARKKRADGSEMTDAEETVDAASSGAAPPTMRRGGSVKKYASGGSVSSASKRADGIAIKGKTRGKFV